MIDNSKLKSEESDSLKESENGEHLEMLSDSERRAKYGVSGSRKAALSKREIMEELSHQRFPWDE